MARWICPKCGKVWDDSRYTGGKNPKGCNWNTSMNYPICKKCAKI